MTMAVTMGPFTPFFAEWVYQHMKPYVRSTSAATPVQRHPSLAVAPLGAASEVVVTWTHAQVRCTRGVRGGGCWLRLEESSVHAGISAAAAAAVVPSGWQPDGGAWAMQVLEWLRSAKLDEFVGAFEANGMTGPDLLDLDHGDLSSMGLSRCTDRKRVLRYRVRWRFCPEGGHARAVCAGLTAACLRRHVSGRCEACCSKAHWK